MFGARAVDATGSDARFAQPIPTHAVAVTDSAVPSSTTVAPTAWVAIGDDVVWTPETDGSHVLVFANDFAEREFVQADLFGADDGVVGASFEAPAPAQVDLGTIPVDAPRVANARFDGSSFSWSLAGGAGAYAIEWTLSSDQSLVPVWWFVAPPETTSAVLPAIPADLVPLGTPQPRTLVAKAADDVDGYKALFTSGATTPARGTHYYALRMTPIAGP